MAVKGKTLEAEVLNVFKRACREDDFQVAEHLLRALETMGCRDKTEGAVQHAYLELANSFHHGSRH